MSLEKTLGRLEARARAKSAKPDPVKIQGAREQAEALRLTPERWAAEQRRFAALTQEEQIGETRERLEATRVYYGEAIAAQKGVDPVKVWLASPGLAQFSLRALEIKLVVLEGATSKADVAGMSERAAELVRLDTWQATAHLDAVSDWRAYQARASHDSAVPDVPPIMEVPRVPHLNPEPKQPIVEEISPSFEPNGD